MKSPAPPPPSSNTLERPLKVEGHVALNISSHCNQNCIFCFEGERAAWSHPTSDEALAIVDEAATHADRIIFMGGEAFHRRDFFDIVSHARSKGLTVDVFTNGLALGSRAFVERLARSGIDTVMCSFHYHDAETYARATRSKPTWFHRLLRGLENVRDWNASNPAHPLELSPEIMLFSYNRGHLADIVALIERHLGGSFRSLNIGTIQPSRVDTTDRLVAPIGGMREEILSFMATWDGSRDLAFTRVPLCLIPGYERLSIDISYKLELVTLEANFADKRAITEMTNYRRGFESSYFRWLCQTCSLRALCTFVHNSFPNETFIPDLDDFVFPSRVDPRAVLRSHGVDGARADELVTELEAVIDDEATWERQFFETADEQLASLGVRSHPLQPNRFVVGQGGSTEELVFSPAQPSPDSVYICGTAIVRVPSSSTTDLPLRHGTYEAVAEAVVTSYEEHGTGTAPELYPDSSTVALAASLWERFGRLLWPGDKGGWTCHSCTIERQRHLHRHVRLVTGTSPEHRAHILITTPGETVEGGFHLTDRDGFSVSLEVPDSSAPDPRTVREIIGTFVTGRAPLGDELRCLGDLIETHGGARSFPVVYAEDARIHLLVAGRVVTLRLEPVAPDRGTVWLWGDKMFVLEGDAPREDPEVSAEISRVLYFMDQASHQPGRDDPLGAMWRVYGPMLWPGNGIVASAAVTTSGLVLHVEGTTTRVRIALSATQDRAFLRHPEFSLSYSHPEGSHDELALQHVRRFVAKIDRATAKRLRSL